MRAESGEVLERQSSVRSIARRKRDEAALAESLGRHRALIRHLPGGAVLMFDPDLTVILGEGSALNALVGREDPVGRSILDLLPQQDRVRIAGYCRDALGGRTQTWRARLGGRVFDATLTPVLADDLVIGGMVVGFDITDRAELEAEQEALHEIAHAVAEDAPPDALLDLVVNRVSTLFGAVGAAIFRLDDDGHVTVVASAPISPAETVPGGRLALSQSTAITQVVEHRTPAALSRYEDSDDPLVVSLRALGAVGGAAAPITIHGMLWGRPWDSAAQTRCA